MFFRDSVQTLQQQRKNTILLSDFKHFAANVLKKVVGGDERFQEFTSQTGRTRSAIQQTELAHLTPVSPRPKARFMNLSATLQWANMVLWHLAHPHSAARRDITTSRMNNKLGWLRNYCDDILRWSRCQDVVSEGHEQFRLGRSKQFVERPGSFDPATIQNDRGPAQCGHLERVMGYEDNRKVFFPGKCFDFSKQVVFCYEVEALKRLVKKQEVRLWCDCPGQGDPLLLSSG